MELINEKQRVQSPLEQLQGHFKRVERRLIECEMVDQPLYVEPLTAEDYLFVKESEKQEPSKRVRTLAVIVVAKVKLEDGSSAFSHPKGPKAAAEAMATSVPPMTFFDLFGAIFSEVTEQDVEALGNG